MKHLLFLISIALLTACGGNRPPQSWAERLQLSPAPDSITFRHARLIHVEQADGYRIVYIDNPWKAGRSLHTYILVPDGGPVPQDMKTGGATVIRTPLRRSIIFTSVHCALIDMLGAESQVAGVADLKYIKVPFVQQGAASGAIVDCGDGLSPVVEKIVDVGADGLLLSPFENSGGYGQLEDIGIPIVECAEYMETSPLARAEWMRFYGMLYGEEERADSLFRVVEQNYRRLTALASTASESPTVLADKMAGPVWYVPGGRSTIGQMLGDAHCTYPWADDDHAGSLQLSFEAVLEKGGDAQLWLLRYDAQKPLTMEQLMSENDGYRVLAAVKGNAVYACNVTTSMFYEETPFRPDLLLQDFIGILHPTLPDLPPQRYYYRVSE